ncbi:MAG: hypothetical protein JWO79_2080, partial [Actinomycetia bacterium]|nr:hypothetical protein [Actinomycetes bacterium]
MDVVLALLAGGRDGALTAALGAAAGAAAMLVCALLLRRGRIAPPPPAPLVDQPPVDLELSRRSVETLSTALVVIDPGDEIALANPAARRLGVVKDGRLPHPMLRALVRQAR